MLVKYVAQSMFFTIELTRFDHQSLIRLTIKAQVRLTRFSSLRDCPKKNEALPKYFSTSYTVSACSSMFATIFRCSASNESLNLKVLYVWKSLKSLMP